LARRSDKLHTVFLDERGLPHFPDEPEPLERMKGEREQRFADMVTGKFFAFEQEHVVAALGQHRGRRAAGRSPADDDGVVSGWCFHRFRFFQRARLTAFHKPTPDPSQEGNWRARSPPLAAPLLRRGWGWVWALL